MTPHFGMAAKAVVVFWGGLLAVCVAAAALLHMALAPGRQEVARVASPSGEWVASLVEVNGGATTAFSYEVRVTSRTPGLLAPGWLAPPVQAVLAPLRRDQQGSSRGLQPKRKRPTGEGWA